MASPADTAAKVQQLITAAVATPITPAQMVAVLDLAIASAMMHDGQMVVSYSIGGRSQTIGIRDAQALREYYRQLDLDQSGAGCIPQLAEFRP